VSKAALVALALLAAPAAAHAESDYDWDWAVPSVELPAGAGVRAVFGLGLVAGELWALQRHVYGSTEPLGGTPEPGVGLRLGLAALNVPVMSLLSGTAIELINLQNRHHRLSLGELALAGLVPEAVSQAWFFFAIASLDPDGGYFTRAAWTGWVLSQVVGVVVTPLVQTAVAHWRREDLPFGVSSSPVQLVPWVDAGRRTQGVALAMAW
jgi:hypothetical protein